ncbi:MAG: hypothetical protein E7666_04270 [Ruminococcaceae bacterium]|nr:hypothetical protein [Oscillospiraceae bacterium]
MSNLILTGLFVLILAVSALWGLLRGLAKSRIRGISIVLCAVAAVATAVLLRATLVSDQMIEETVIPLLVNSDMGQYAEMLELSPTLTEVLLHTVYSIVSPLLVLVFFIVYSFLTWFIFLIVTLILGGALRRQNQRSAFHRLRGMAWGAIQGVVIFVILLIPISATLDLVPPVMSAVEESGMLEGEAEGVQEIVDTYVAPLNDNALLVAYRGMGGNTVTDMLTSFTVQETETTLAKEIDSVAGFACNILKLSKTDFASYTSVEAQTIVALADSFEHSVLLPTIAGEIIYGATDAWLGGETFLGAAKPSFGDADAMFGPFFDALLRILNADARQHAALQADIRTVAEMVAVMAENGVFANFSNTELLLETLSSNGIIASLVEKLGSNNSMKALIPEMTNLGMRAIATTLGIPADVDEVYGTIMDDIALALNQASGLTGDAQIDAITEDLRTAFDEAGIPIDSEIIDSYSVSMIQDLINEADGKQLTSADVQAFFEVYAIQMAENPLPAKDSSNALAARENDIFAGTVYEGKTEEDLKKSGAAVLAAATQQLAMLEEPSAAQAKTILTEAYATLLENDETAMARISTIEVTKAVTTKSMEATSGLRSSETVVTVKVTVSDLLTATEGAADSITSETIQKEAAAIEAIFGAANNLMTQMSGGQEMDLKTVAGAVGEILDSLQTTTSVGSEKTAKLFTAVLQSETVRKTADLDMTTATQMAQKATEGDVKYTDTMNAVSSGVDLFTKLGQDGKEPTEEEIIELIRNINPATAGMIEVYVTAERIRGYGVPDQYADTSASLISETFSYMASTEMSEAEYEKEAKALNQILNVAISAKSHSTGKKLFGDILPTATETVDTFMASGAVTHAFRVTLLDENGEVKEGKFDAFGLADRIPEESADYIELVDAMNAYSDAHQDKETKQTVKAISALFGVPMN